MSERILRRLPSAGGMTKSEIIGLISLVLITLKRSVESDIGGFSLSVFHYSAISYQIALAEGLIALCYEVLCSVHKRRAKCGSGLLFVDFQQAFKALGALERETKL